MYIYSYDVHSETAKAIRNHLKYAMKMIRHEGSTFKGSVEKIVLNWGCSDLPREIRKCRVINNENSVADAVNKIRSLTKIQSMLDSAYLEGAYFSTVPFTTSRDEAIRWLNEGSRVIARTQITGHDGSGIVECTRDNVPQARLYTRFINAVKEYRVTCSNDEIIGVQRKVRLDTPPEGGYNDDFKTTAGGYGFKYVTRNIPEDVLEAAKMSVNILGLDFGGVDVIWDGTRAYVLEVNTAPQLTPILVRNFCDWLVKNYL